MPLQIKYEHDLDKPVVVCDHCGREITDARHGNYEWEVDRNGLTIGGPIRFTHKACCLPFERANGGAGGWFSGELAHLPVFLLDNLAVDLEKASAGAAYVSQS